ncbi:MAG: DUF3783 domain-containing protein [Oscillospiraceae bacterium]
MKSRIISDIKEIIILYKYDEYREVIGRIAAKQGMTLVQAENASDKLGYLAGFKGFSAAADTSEAESGCMVVSGINGRRLDTLLNALRENGVRIPLKAVVTASNQSWTIKQLVKELSAEHQRMGG